MKCIDNATGNCYPYTGQVNRSCACPCCKCTCIFACNKDDYQKAKLAGLCLPVGSDARINNEPSAKTSMFVCSMLNGAFASSLDYMENGAHNQLSVNGGGRNDSKEPMMAFGDKLFYENAALHIVRKGQNLDAGCLEYLRQEVGKPNSWVTLPDGTGFDTNYVAHQSQHAQNNRLRQGDRLTGIKEVHAGMVDNLSFDLTNHIPEFIKAARKKRAECVDLTGASSEEPDYKTPPPPSSRVVMVTKSTPPQNKG